MRNVLVAAFFSAMGLAFLFADHTHAAAPARQIEDPKAVYLDAPEFKAKGDGVADDTEALQNAINKVRETTTHGIVFVAPGNYRISKPVYVWGGIRLIGLTGTANRRPVFYLGDKTPGYQELGENNAPRYMLQFVGSRPNNGQPIPDGDSGTFYSALSHINMEIGEGNPAAVGVRFHVARHCFVSHVDFHIGSGRAGIEGAGNESENLKFFGGDYGIVTAPTAPSWPFLLIDSRFEGQRMAGIKTDASTMTLVRASFKKSPVAVEITEKQWEGLWMKDCRLEDISHAALVVGNDATERTKVNIENLVCVKVPTFARLAPGGRVIPGYDDGALYAVPAFSFGLKFDAVGAKGEMSASCDCEFTGLSKAPAPVAGDIPALLERDTWVNVKTLGVKGDGVADDTAALKDAIAKNKVLYLPMGHYKISDTITLKADTVLIGLHPAMTQLVLPDGAPAFAAAGKALLEAPQNTSPIVSGVGIETGNNPHAIGAKWMATEKSFMGDVKFFGGHGGVAPDGSPTPPYNADRTGDADPNRKWDTGAYSLWITDGGGGTFKNIWSANPLAKAGLCISDTKTEGRLYAVSVEHHVTTEVKIKNASNWRIFALRTEEEKLEGPKAIALDVENASEITFANLCVFRMAPTPGKYAVRLKGCESLTFKGVRNYSPRGDTTFENTFFNADRDTYTSAKDIAWLIFGGG